MSTAHALELERENEHSRTLCEALQGLSQTPKRLPCKLFYDARGSRLFERITRLPSYYLTRTETSILARHAREIAEHIGPRAVLVELGSGASQKTLLLLDELSEPRVYVPVDISRELLLASAAALQKRYPRLSVRPLVKDFAYDFRLPLEPHERDSPTTAFFPGSTIGNFESAGAVAFLCRVRRSSPRGTQLVVGVDLPKDAAVLEQAYDDPQGVTREFNLNALTVLNREYGAHFRLEDFAHRAVWNAEESRVEMQLVSKRAHSVRVGSQSFAFRAGEALVTEHCYKHSLEGFRELAASAGYAVSRVWLDDRHGFSVQLLAPAAE